MKPQTLAFAFAALATLPVLMQIGLALGAPWGRFALGGLFPGALPPLWRVLAIVQALLLVAKVVIVFDFANVISLGAPRVFIWLTLGLVALTTIANNLTPSDPERMLWGPVTLLMLVTLVLLIRSRSAGPFGRRVS